MWADQLQTSQICTQHCENCILMASWRTIVSCFSPSPRCIGKLKNDWNLCSVPILFWNFQRRDFAIVLAVQPFSLSAICHGIISSNFQQLALVYHCCEISLLQNASSLITQPSTKTSCSDIGHSGIICHRIWHSCWKRLCTSIHCRLTFGHLQIPTTSIDRITKHIGEKSHDSSREFNLFRCRIFHWRLVAVLQVKDCDTWSAVWRALVKFLPLWSPGRERASDRTGKSHSSFHESIYHWYERLALAQSTLLK